MKNAEFRVDAKKGDQSGLDAAKKGLDDISQGTAQAQQEERQAADTTARNNTEKIRLAQTLERLTRNVPVLGGAFTALRSILQGLTFAGILGGLGALVQMGAQVYGAVIAPMFEGARKVKIALQEWVGAVDQVTAIQERLASQIKTINGIDKAYESAARSADKLAEAQAKLEDAKAAREIAGMAPGPGRDQAQRDLQARQLERQTESVETRKEREIAGEFRAGNEVMAIAKARDAAAQALTKAFQDAQKAGSISTQQQVLKDVASVNIGGMSRGAFAERYNGMTPEAAAARARQELKEGRPTYTQDTEASQRVEQAAQAYRGLVERTKEAASAFERLRKEVDANLGALDLEKQTIAEKAGTITDEADRSAVASITGAIDKWLAADDARREAAGKIAAKAQAEDDAKLEQAINDRRAREFEKADPERKRQMIAEDIAGLVKQGREEAAAGNKGAAAMIANQIAGKRDLLASISTGPAPEEPAAPGPGEVGDAAYGAAAARSRKTLAMGRNARRFRGKLTGDEGRSLGEGFADKLIRGQLSAEASGMAGSGGRPPTQDTATLQKETNDILRRIEQKTGLAP